MAFDFPASPSENQLFTPSGGPSYIYKAPRWLVYSTVTVGTAQAVNRIVNPAMQIQQDASMLGGRPADQWAIGVTIAHTLTRVDDMTPFGSRFSIGIGHSVTKTLVASDYYGFTQTLEGIRTTDFQWGFPAAKRVVLRIGVWVTMAGTYCISLNSVDNTRSYVDTFTISAGEINSHQYRTFSIPGDTGGTAGVSWPLHNVAGLSINVTWTSGSDYNTATKGAWVSGGKYAHTSITNVYAVAPATFYLFDVGLYLDPNNTGIAPPWTKPDEAEELRTCQRYLQYLQGIFSGYVASGVLYMLRVPYAVAPRANPILSADYSYGVMFPMAAGVLSNPGYAVQENRTANGTGDGAYFTTTFKVDSNM